MNPDDYLLPIVSLVIIVLFLIWAIWHYYQQKGSTINFNNQAFYCPTGQCATNIYSGVKRCPDTSQQAIQLNPGLEVCNAPNVCLDPQTPYALDANFGTNITGQCTINQCQCLNQAQCPNYITAYLQSNEGQPWEPLTSSRFNLIQQTSIIDNAGYVINQPPYSFPLDGITFCTIPIQWLERLYPIQCKAGTLAALSPNPSQATLDNIAELPFGCVLGSPCGLSGTPVFDTSEQKLTCQQLCPSGQQPRWNPDTDQVVCTADPNNNNIIIT